MSLKALENVSITPKQGREFIHLLATDDKFREELKRSPKAAFARLNIQVELSPSEIKLPPKEEIAKALAALKKGEPWTTPGGVGAEVDAHWAFFAFFAFLL